MCNIQNMLIQLSFQKCTKAMLERTTWINSIQEQSIPLVARKRFVDSFDELGKVDALYQSYQLHECVGSSKKSQSNQISSCNSNAISRSSGPSFDDLK
jgi:hypothetical protein